MSSRKAYKHDDLERRYSASTPATPSGKKIKYTANDPNEPNTIEFNNQISSRLLRQPSKKNKTVSDKHSENICSPEDLDAASKKLNELSNNEIANFYIPKAKNNQAKLAAIKAGSKEDLRNIDATKNKSTGSKLSIPKKDSKEEIASEDKSPNAQNSHKRSHSKDKITSNQISKEKNIAESKSPNNKSDDNIYSPTVFASNKETKTTPKSLPSNPEHKRADSQPLSTIKHREDNKQKNINQKLIEAVKQGKAAEIEKILCAGANVNCQELTSGNTPFFLAVDRQYFEIALNLKLAGAKCEQLNSVGNNPVDQLNECLITAVKDGRARDVDLLIQLPTAVNYQEPGTKNTALHYAMAKKDYNCAIKLLKAGADCNILNKNNIDPFNDLNDQSKLIFTAFAQTIKNLRQELADKTNLVSEKSKQQFNAIEQLKQQQEQHSGTTALSQLEKLSSKVEKLIGEIQNINYLSKKFGEEFKTLDTGTKTMLVRILEAQNKNNELESKNVQLEKMIEDLQKTIKEVTKTLTKTETHNKQLDNENKKLHDLVASISNNQQKLKPNNKFNKVEEDSEEFVTDEEGSMIKNPVREQVIIHSGGSNLQHTEEMTGQMFLSTEHQENF